MNLEALTADQQRIANQHMILGARFKRNEYNEHKVELVAPNGTVLLQILSWGEVIEGGEFRPKNLDAKFFDEMVDAIYSMRIAAKYEHDSGFTVTRENLLLDYIQEELAEGRTPNVQDFRIGVQRRVADGILVRTR